MDGDRQWLELFQQAPGFVAFLRGPEHTFELVNAAYLQLVGHREIIGKTAREALPEVEGQGFFELLDQVYRTGVPYVGTAERGAFQYEPGGPLTERFLDFVYQPIRDARGDVVGIFAQGQDVTLAVRHAAQRDAVTLALQASEARYRSLFESIDDGFCIIEVLFDDTGKPNDYRFLATNQAFESHTGLHEAQGKRVLELVPDLDAGWFETYGRVATTGEAHRLEQAAPAMNRHFDVYATRVGEPSLRQVAVVFKDVTARKRIEEEREQLLEREQIARQEAEAAWRLRDEFLATVSHELRTPLNSMLGWVQMLRAGSLPVDKRERALETIERNARAQAQLIEDLLDVSRVLAGQLRLELETVDAHAVIEAAVETVRPTADARRIQLGTSLARVGDISGDAGRLQQIVGNLLSNAVKFTPVGGSVDVELEQHGDIAEIRVTDTGRGIEPDFQPFVFERFRQAQSGTTRAHGGLGIGLAIVRQLVAMHGGTVSVRSEGLGHGSTFVVRLPCAAISSKRELDRSGRPDDTGPLALTGTVLAGRRLLVVEDDHDTREMVATLLEGFGAEVARAESAAKGWQMFQTMRPDTVLSDIGMPEEDGYSFVARIRALPAEAGGQVPVIALTAFAQDADRERAMSAGFTQWLAKPVEPRELISMVVGLRQTAAKPAAAEAS